MGLKHSANRNRQFRTNPLGLWAALFTTAVAAALVFGGGYAIFPRASAAGTRLQTIISIGSGSLQVSFTLNIK